MTNKFITVDVENVKASIASLFAQYPSLADDEELLRDTLEGSTDLKEILERIMSIKFDAEDMTTAIKAREASLKARRERIEAKADAMKGLALSLMQAAKQERVELTEALLTIRKPSKRVEINDIDALPQGYYRTDKVADKKAIAESFKAGEAIPGASYVDGSEGLTVKRS